MSNKHFIGKRLFSFSDNGLRDPVSRVTLLVDDNNSVTSGDDTGLELLASCPYADDTLAQAMLNQVKGYQYRAFNAQSADLDPAAELGDGVTVDGVYSVLAGITDKGDGYPDIFAPGDREEEDEYPEGGPLTRLFNRQLAQTRSLISKNSGSIELLVAKTGELGEQYSSIGLRLDSISLTVYGKAATETEEAVLGLTGRMNAAETSIALNTEGISMTVKKGSIISAINQSAETVKISAGKINLEGYVTFSALKNGPDADKGQTVIDGGWLKSQTIKGGKYQDLDGNVSLYLDAETENGVGTYGMKLDDGDGNVFRVWNGDAQTAELSMKGYSVFSVYYGQIRPWGNWNFEGATVTGLKDVTFVPVFQ